ncbi:baseplate J/gp47 family protein [Paraburkholderia acidiphila]|uniref:Phage baseplate protein n=1 Tax=Paraburkholderia acidiphila TaxID=2571747 RepID=A0A7Z2G7R4_9BURK|nr:baseplate J/gp47 family protein [Paraburkholderia acidiphila]QGZ56760.1 phage baseplate protein [Paraburkholderia acidiphila]
MPYSRPTLTDLRTQIWSDIQTGLGSILAFLQKAVLKILGAALAAMIWGVYGYLDWIAKQAVPWTAQDEYLAGWGALKDTYLKEASATVLNVLFTGAVPGTPIDAGAGITRQDTTLYTVLTAAEVASDGTLTVEVQAAVAGSAANSDNGTSMTLTSAIAGIPSTGTVSATVTTGADVEDPEDYRTRVMDAFQNPAQGGAQSDYVKWATDIAGVTRAWCQPNGFGAGTVVLYFMMDDAESAHAGFPQGANGVSQYDQGPNGSPRDTVATGDQLTVANAIISEQPVTALVYACSPIENQIGFTISGLSTAGSTTQAAIDSALADVFFRNGQPKGTIDWSDITGAVNSVSGTSGYLITAVTSTVGGVPTSLLPNANITMGAGQLPVLGTVNYV